MKTAEEVLREVFSKEYFIANGEGDIPQMVEAMEAYALQFKGKPVTELNERNSVDEGETPICEHLDVTPWSSVMKGHYCNVCKQWLT